MKTKFEYVSLSPDFLNNLLLYIFNNFFLFSFMNLRGISFNNFDFILILVRKQNGRSREIL